MVEILSSTTKMGRNTNGGRRTGNSRTYSDREQDAELSTPTSNSYYDTTTDNNSKGGISIDDHRSNPIKENYRRNFGKDGIYVPPETVWSNNNQGAMSTHSRQQNETASQDNTASDRISPPQHQYYEDDPMIEQQQQRRQQQDRMVNIDQPFDQANAYASNIIERTMSGGRTVGARSGTALRGSTLSDFRCDDSAFTSVVSSKFENIWVSSPDDQSASSPSRRPIINERSNEDNNDDYLEDEDEDNNMNGGRFIVPSPKYSGPCIIDKDGISYDDSNYYQSSAMITTTSGDPMIDLTIPPSIPQLKHTNNIDNSPMMMNGEVGYAEKYDEENNNQHSEGLIDDEREATAKDDDSLFNFAAEKKQLKKAKQQVKDSKDYLSSKNNNATTTQKLVPHRVRRRNRQRREEKILSETTATTDDDDDCDTSTENYGMAAISPTSLQERAHQAWKSRQTKKNSTTSTSLRPPPPNQDISNVSNVSTNVTSIRSSKGANIVSFGETNTIHRFESEQQDDTAEVMSLDRSLNSEYTKTIESEVEDMIKDIFLIGTPDKNKPGRRKYRFKPEVKRKISKELKATASETTGVVLRETNVESSIEEDNTVPSLNESDFVLEKKEKKHIISPTNDDSTKKLAEERTRPSAQSKKPQQSRTMNARDDRSASIASIGGSSLDGTNTLDDTNTLESSELRENLLEDPFNAMIGLVEGGLSAMTSAIGYALGDPTTSPKDDHEMKKERKTKTKQLRPNHGSKKQDTCYTSEYSIIESCGLAIGSPAIMSEGNRQLTSDMSDMMTKDLWFGSDNVQSVGSNRRLLGSKTTGKDSVDIYEDRSERTASFNNRKNEERFKSDIYQLAIHAAYSVHKLQGVEYDDSFAIDLHKEVKICPVSLKLPLGIIFLENDGTLRARCVLCRVVLCCVISLFTHLYFTHVCSFY
jgi:hypothetical protein